MAFHLQLGKQSYSFSDLKTLLAKATPLRSGDQLAGVAAHTAEERVPDTGDPINSSTSPLTQPNYHRRHEWRKIKFQ